MSLTWYKVGHDWFATWGSFRADVRGPTGPLGFCHWSVHRGDRAGGSGGTSSVGASKRAAEQELQRFATFLRLEQASDDRRKNEQAKTSRDPNPKGTV